MQTNHLLDDIRVIYAQTGATFHFPCKMLCLIYDTVKAGHIIAFLLRSPIRSRVFF